MEPLRQLAKDKLSGKRVYAVMSAKGGVGKSVISSLLALTIGNTTLIDLDIHTMAIPKLFGLEGKLHKVTKNGIEPFEVKTTKIVSLSGIVKDNYVILPGGNQSSIMESLIAYSHIDTNTVLFDLPPGLGDEILVLERITDFTPIVVTTPSKISKKVVGYLTRYLIERGKEPKILVNLAYIECGGKVVKPFGEYEGFGLPIDPNLEDYIGRIQDYEGIIKEKLKEFIKTIN
ncbi:chromosome partitioning ATPase [Acidianus hospitalis W1]|uniref:Chromosome partitioning ATPase n=1 Tax=Acidianus hospitalis (strain W1) TaxID=933801 RepID=F4B4U5_ACIHW|nr:P-loop NTPase [Acidianus hospitalis]AEE93110.1 chromosome partitioning ATPase [Acidianus hospitalis W1]